MLLVTRAFLASDFIAENELPPLLEAAKTEGLTIFWIAVGFSLYEETEIADYQAANNPSRPLNSLSESDADFELVKIAKAVDAVLDRTSGLGAAGADAHPLIVDTINLDEGTAYWPGIEKLKLPRILTPEDRVRGALSDGKWAWRSIGALAAKSGLKEDETLKLVQAAPDIELGRAKSGRTIARLRETI